MMSSFSKPQLNRFRENHIMENIGYVLLSIVAVCWVIGMIVGMIAAFPFGIIGLLAIAGIGLLLAKVIKDRLGNAEDDHYSNTIDK